MPPDPNPPVQPAMTDAELARELREIERKLAVDWSSHQSLSRTLKWADTATEHIRAARRAALEAQTFDAIWAVCNALERFQAQIAVIARELAHVRSRLQ